MNRLTRIFCTIILVFASVLFAADEIRKLGVEDLEFGQSTATSAGGVVSTQINASLIPLSTGSDNTETVINSLQAQITTLETTADDLADNVALKADLASPTLTGTVTVTGSVTVSGEVTAQQYATSASDGEHYINIANSTAPASPSIGDCYFDNTTTSNTFLCYNGSAWVEPTVHTKDFVIYGYSASHDNVVRWKADSIQTLTQLDCITGGTDNVTVTLYECDGNAANCSTTGLASAATSTNVADTSASNGSIDAGDWIKASLSSLAGTATSVACTVRYLVTRQ